MHSFAQQNGQLVTMLLFIYAPKGMVHEAQAVHVRIQGRRCARKFTAERRMWIKTHCMAGDARASLQQNVECGLKLIVPGNNLTSLL